MVAQGPDSAYGHALFSLHSILKILELVVYISKSEDYI